MRIRRVQFRVRHLAAVIDDIRQQGESLKRLGETPERSRIRAADEFECDGDSLRSEPPHCLNDGRVVLVHVDGRDIQQPEWLGLAARCRWPLRARRAKKSGVQTMGHECRAAEHGPDHLLHATLRVLRQENHAVGRPDRMRLAPSEHQQSNGLARQAKARQLVDFERQHVSAHCHNRPKRSCYRTSRGEEQVTPRFSGESTKLVALPKRAAQVIAFERRVGAFLKPLSVGKTRERRDRCPYTHMIKSSRWRIGCA